MDAIRALERDEFPLLLREISDPPARIFVRGTLPAGEHLRFLCVVGSRRYTSYGRTACETLIAALAGFPVVIVSGLALGIDSIAHRAALNAGLTTVAILGSGLGWDALYPRNHVALAREILERGGTLVSEFEEHFQATPWSFPQRNRVMAGLSHAVLVVEGEQKSGTMITARLAGEYSRDVLAVPGPITARTSEGVNRLIRDGATPITSSADILEALDVKIQNPSDKVQTENLSEDERRVVEILREPMPRDELVRALGMQTHEANALLSALEIKGLITETLGVVRFR